MRLIILNRDPTPLDDAADAEEAAAVTTTLTGGVSALPSQHPDSTLATVTSLALDDADSVCASAADPTGVPGSSSPFWYGVQSLLATPTLTMPAADAADPRWMSWSQQVAALAAAATVGGADAGGRSPSSGGDGVVAAVTMAGTW